MALFGPLQRQCNDGYDEQQDEGAAFEPARIVYKRGGEGEIRDPKLPSAYLVCSFYHLFSALNSGILMRAPLDRKAPPGLLSAIIIVGGVEDMLKVAKILLVLAGILLIVDAVLMALRLPNPLLGLSPPYPVTLTLLGVGVLPFVFGSKAFSK